MAQQQQKLLEWAERVFYAYWTESLDVSKDEILTELANDAGMDAGTLLEDINKAGIKQALRENTDELIARGGYGSPTIFLNNTDMFFGNDRLPLVEFRLQQSQ